MDKKEKNVIIGLSVLLVILSGAWIALRLHNVSMQNKLKDAQTEYNVAEKKYDRVLEQAEEKYINQGATDNDSIVQSVSSQKNNYNVIKRMSTKFFSIYDTYTDNNSYLARKDKLQNLMTDNVKNSGMFDNGKDISGHSMITALQLTMKFNSLDAYVQNYDDNTINAIVSVNYESSSQGNDAQNGQQIYRVTFDKKQQKFTNIQLLQLSGVNSSLDN